MSDPMKYDALMWKAVFQQGDDDAVREWGADGILTVLGSDMRAGIGSDSVAMRTQFGGVNDFVPERKKGGFFGVVKKKSPWHDSAVERRSRPVLVVRDGETKTIRCIDLVIGDIVLLNCDEPKIPADLVLIEGAVAVSERELTGESALVAKRPTARMYSETEAQLGSGRAVVCAVGRNTMWASISAAME